MEIPSLANHQISAISCHGARNRGWDDWQGDEVLEEATPPVQAPKRRWGKEEARHQKGEGSSNNLSKVTKLPKAIGRSRNANRWKSSRLSLHWKKLWLVPNHFRSGAMDLLEKSKNYCFRHMFGSFLKISTQICLILCFADVGPPQIVGCVFFTPDSQTTPSSQFTLVLGSSFQPQMFRCVETHYNEAYNAVTCIVTYIFYFDTIFILRE